MLQIAHIWGSVSACRRVGGWSAFAKQYQLRSKPPGHFSRVETQIPKFGIVLVLVVVLVLGALGFRDRKETDGTNLFCQSDCETIGILEDEDDSSNSERRIKTVLFPQTRSADTPTRFPGATSGRRPIADS